MRGPFWRSPLRTLDRKTLRRRGHRVTQRRRRRALPRLNPPQTLLQRCPLLEVHAVEEVHPTIRARVDEQLDLRRQGELILGCKERDFHPTISRERNLQTRDGIAHIRKGQRLPRP